MRKIVYQEKVIKFLTNSFRKNRTSHAYIFLGPEGVGKSFTAKYFTQFVNCENRSAIPCFECSSCVKIENNNHPDVYWIGPEEGSQGIKIEAIRQLQEKISLKPYEAKFKIFILEKADFLLEEAANCLLKTLEEPPGDSILILLAEEKERFPPTIMSRCQIIKFSLLKKETVEKFLSENYILDKNKISLCSKLAEGSLGKAMSLVEKDYFKRRDFILEKILEKKEFNEDLWWKEKDILIDILKFLSEIFRDAVLEKIDLNNLIVNKDRLDLVKKISLAFSQEELCNLVERLNFYFSLIQSNVNLRLIFTNLEIDLEKFLAYN